MLLNSRYIIEVQENKNDFGNIKTHTKKKLISNF